MIKLLTVIVVGALIGLLLVAALIAFLNSYEDIYKEGEE